MTMRYLTAGEAARLLGAAWGRRVDPDMLHRYVKRNKLRAIRQDASRNLYPSDEVEALAANPPRPGNRSGRPRTRKEPPDA